MRVGCLPAACVRAMDGALGQHRGPGFPWIPRSQNNKTARIIREVPASDGRGASLLSLPEPGFWKGGL